MGKIKEHARGRAGFFVALGAFAAGALVVALLLGGCSGPDPVVTESVTGTATPPVSATASPSPSPSLTGTAALLAQLPEGATYPDLDGAIKTAEFFVELYGTMLQTGDTALWDALSGPDCDYCKDASSTADDYRDGGTHVTEGAIKVDPSRTGANLADDGFTYVGVVAHQDQIVTTEQDSTPQIAATPSDAGLILQMELVEGHWRVNGVQVVEVGEI